MIRLNQKTAAHTLEYCALIALVALGIIMMKDYLFRSTFAHLKMWEDGVSDSLYTYVPRKECLSIYYDLDEWPRQRCESGRHVWGRGCAFSPLRTGNVDINSSQYTNLLNCNSSSHPISGSISEVSASIGIDFSGLAPGSYCSIWSGCGHTVTGLCVVNIQ